MRVLTPEIINELTDKNVFDKIINEDIIKIEDLINLFEKSSKIRAEKNKSFFFKILTNIPRHRNRTIHIYLDIP